MTLVQSWIDSLQLLKPKNLQLFAMVTLKSIIEAYKLYFKYFGWVIAIMIILAFIAPDYRLAFLARNMDAMLLYVRIVSVVSILYSLLFLAACFATRPSIGRKDGYYFLRLYKKFALCWLIWFILSFTATILQMFSGLFQLYPFSSFYIFFVLFFADAETNIKNFFASICNAFKMIIYNLPLMLVFGFCFYFTVALAYTFIYITPFAEMFMGTLLLPIGICTYANIYIKKLHDQFDLYIKQPQ